MSRRRDPGQGSEIRKSADWIRGASGSLTTDPGSRLLFACGTNESNRHEADEEHESCPQDADAGGADDGRVHQGSERDDGSGARFAQRVPEQEFLDAACHEHVVDAVADEDREQHPERERESLARRARHQRNLKTIAVMSSLCAAPRAKSRTSAKSESSSACGSMSRFLRTHVRMRDSPYSSPSADSASDTPSL